MNTKTQSTSSAITAKLSVMMFLQFFIWGAWFATLAQCLGSNGLGDSAGGAYGSAPYGAIFAPLFLGLIADRFFPSQIVMGVLFLLGGVLMYFAHGAAVAGDGGTMVWFFIGHMLCYMPTLGLGNTVAFTHLDRVSFPKVRVWGTIGWIAAGLFIGFQGWSADLNILRVAAIVSVILGAFCFVLPNTPAPAKGEKVNLRSLLMVDAFRMLLKPSFAVFIICSFLICIPLAYYFANAAVLLGDNGFTQPASTLTLGQMSEIFFMLLIPFFFRRLGVKWMILIGMLAWVIRYVLFAYGGSTGMVWMLFLGVAIHGICYDFFFVTGFMYTDRAAPEKVRGQAQSMLVFFTQGIGMWIGYKIAFSKAAVLETSADLQAAIADGRAEGVTIGEVVADPTYFDRIKAMFSVDMPESVDSDLIAKAMGEWQSYWLLPAGMAAVIVVLFFVAFRDTSEEEAE
ncbi:MFS transporter [Akkermansiaceae bacterium]|jgi:nucleoside transporter|nr:MFS transporter [Akkermansiaceae bacterium]